MLRLVKNNTTYFFSQEELNNTQQTISELRDNPSKFQRTQTQPGDRIVELTASQNRDFLEYMRNDNFCWNSFIHEENATHLLGFSYGESPDVNSQLALIVENILMTRPSLKVFVQWEIADTLFARNKDFRKRVQSIKMDPGHDYITSIEVTRKFKKKLSFTEPVRLIVVSQSWHAPRCVKICSEEGFDIVQGGFIDDFSKSDPQPWTRDWLSWIIKESLK
ncbi:MAG: YdcF family protein [Proteobacteria bacterium]|nr:YdcF family protein [Pseudomonadota bacterium]